MQNLRYALIAPFLWLVALFGTHATVTAQSGSYNLAGGSSVTVNANAGATNVQVTPGTGTVQVQITYADGKVETLTATPDAPVNRTRYNREHQAYEVKKVIILYPPQPPNTHPATGRYRIQ